MIITAHLGGYTLERSQTSVLDHPGRIKTKGSSFSVRGESGNKQTSKVSLEEILEEITRMVMGLNTMPHLNPH